MKSPVRTFLLSTATRVAFAPVHAAVREVGCTTGQLASFDNVPSGTLEFGDLGQPAPSTLVRSLRRIPQACSLWPILVTAP